MADAATEAFNNKISRQRLDHIEHADGTVEAVLTVTLPGIAKPFVFRAPATVDEAKADLGPGDVAGDVGSIFSDIGKGLKKIGRGIGKAVKSVASSKVFKTAAKGLAMAAPALGPLAPVALTASGAMATTSALVGARRKAAHGDKKGAAQLTALAVKTANTVAPKNAHTLLKIAADKSRNAHAVAVSGKATKAPKSTKSTKPRTSSAARTSSPRALPASTSSKALTGPQLLAAARSGRVFVIQAR